jgi:large subunit ribosomal protein L13
VVIINASKVRLTGKKMEKKKYYSHSGWPGGLKEITAKKLLEKKPTELIKRGVRGMLPKNPLGRKMLKKLKVYPLSEHPHKAQKPQLLGI